MRGILKNEEIYVLNQKKWLKGQICSWKGL